MHPLRIGLFGFGRTGRLVARTVLTDPDLELAWVVRRTVGDREQFASRALALADDRGPLLPTTSFKQRFLAGSLHPVDVVVDFAGALAVHTYAPLAATGTRVVSAVAHYAADELALLKSLAAKTAVLHAPNITLGINFLFVAAHALQQLLPDADIAVVEEHFRQKADRSGTALRLARALGVDEERGVHSVRVGGVVGRHEVLFGLANQTVRLIHESIDRSAFGHGAAFAARWLGAQPAGLYSMESALRDRMRTAFLGV